MASPHKTVRVLEAELLKSDFYLQLMKTNVKFYPELDDSGGPSLECQ